MDQYLFSPRSARGSDSRFHTTGRLSLYPTRSESALDGSALQRSALFPNAQSDSALEESVLNSPFYATFSASPHVLSECWQPPSLLAPTKRTPPWPSGSLPSRPHSPPPDQLKDTVAGYFPHPIGHTQYTVRSTRFWDFAALRHWATAAPQTFSSAHAIDDALFSDQHHSSLSSRGPTSTVSEVPVFDTYPTQSPQVPPIDYDSQASTIPYTPPDPLPSTSQDSTPLTTSTSVTSPDMSHTAIQHRGPLPSGGGDGGPSPVLASAHDGSPVDYSQCLYSPMSVSNPDASSSLQVQPPTIDTQQQSSLMGNPHSSYGTQVGDSFATSMAQDSTMGEGSEPRDSLVPQLGTENIALVETARPVTVPKWTRVDDQVYFNNQSLDLVHAPGVDPLLITPTIVCTTSVTVPFSSIASSTPRLQCEVAPVMRPLVPQQSSPSQGESSFPSTPSYTPHVVDFQRSSAASLGLHSLFDSSSAVSSVVVTTAVITAPQPLLPLLCSVYQRALQRLHWTPEL